MVRDDNSKFLLYMEPQNPTTKEPINDEITRFIEKCFNESIEGTSNYSDIKKRKIS